ncbi:MAG: zinc ribbon domain-containing protein [Chloroflexota bacterium]
MVRCSDCGAENLAAARYCHSCGQALAVANECPNCGTEVTAGSRFCHSCGAHLRADSRDTYESDVPDAPTAGVVPDLAPAAAWHEVTELMAGLAEGPPSSAPAPRRLTAADWVSLLGEPLVSDLALAPCLTGNGVGPRFATEPFPSTILERQAAAALLAQQYVTTPPPSRPAKGRRPWSQ